MKNKQNGFIAPLLIGIIFLLFVGGGTYFYLNNKIDSEKISLESVDRTTDVSEVINTEQKNINNASTASEPLTTQEIDYTITKINGYDTPQIVNFKNLAIMKKVNLTMSEIVSSFGCPVESGDTSKNSFESKIKVSYAKNNIFSVSIHNAYYCGGAYPTNDSDESITFDMNTGEEVVFTKLFLDYEKNRKDIMKIIFENQINKYSGTSSDQSCNGMYSMDNIDSGYDTGNYFFDIGYKIEGDGITGKPSFPHVIEACSEEGHASVEKLKQYIDSSSILFRLL